MIDCAQKKDFPRLLEIWESSVKSTHHFLKEEDFEFYKSKIPRYFDAVNLYASRNECGEIRGFLGVSGMETPCVNIEMLFVDTAFIGTGEGKKLLNFAIEKLGATKVDVNEQNKNALSFYEHFGFKITSRSERDGEGKNYPLLHLQRTD